MSAPCESFGCDKFATGIMTWKNSDVRLMLCEEHGEKLMRERPKWSTRQELSDLVDRQI